MIDAQDLLSRVAAGGSLSQDEATGFLEGFVAEQVSHVQLAAFLTALHCKGETSSEIAGVAAAIRRHMTPIKTRHPRAVDTCGTGGDGSRTFNISTAAAIVAAACGVPVAKHGNRKVTSRSGSADALAALGVNIEAPLPVVERCLDEEGLTFCFAPLWHPSLKAASAVRRDLGFPTVFNLVGPLANPAGVSLQLIGVGRRELRPKMAEALRMLGCRRALVVWGDGLDEVALHGPTEVSFLRDGAIEELRWRPEMFGLKPAPLETLQVDGPDASAAVIRAVLAGETGPIRDVTLLNAGAALWLAGAAPTLAEAADQAAAGIDSGAAAGLLERLARCSHEPADRASVESGL